MPQDKQDLEKLLKLIERWANEEGNEDFKKDLEKNYGSKSTALFIDEYSNDSIKKIYEYCLRDIIRVQAKSFYADFKYPSLVSQLEHDFIRMEHYRRQNDFENFCFAMFQQVECIVNYLTSLELTKERVKTERNSTVTIKFNFQTKSHERGGNVTLEKLVAQSYKVDKISEIFSRKLEDWYFNNKLRVVLYFFCFNAELKGNTDEFEKFYEIGNYLYQVRNLNHRGGIQSLYQIQITDKVKAESPKYFLRFLGFFEHFISSLNSTANIVVFQQAINKPLQNNEVLNKIRQNLQS